MVLASDQLGLSDDLPIKNSLIRILPLRAARHSRRQDPRRLFSQRFCQQRGAAHCPRDGGLSMRGRGDFCRPDSYRASDRSKLLLARE